VVLPGSNRFYRGSNLPYLSAGPAPVKIYNQ